MKSSSIKDWKVGDIGKIKSGHIVQVKSIAGHCLRVFPYECNCEIKHDNEPVVFIPSHAEIEKIKIGDLLHVSAEAHTGKVKLIDNKLPFCFKCIDCGDLFYVSDRDIAKGILTAL